MLQKRHQRNIRHRVHRIPPNQRIHIQHIAVLQVLCACACPQRPLNPRPLALQRREPIACEFPPEIAVRHLSVGNRRLAHQPFQVRRLFPRHPLQPPIDHAIHPAHKKRRHRRHISRIAARLRQILQPADIGIPHPRVGVQRKYQRYIHIDALADKRPYRRYPLRRRRHLDHHIRPPQLRM